MRILIVRLSAIGDCTLVLPVVRAILKQSPDCDITWLIGHSAYSLLKDCAQPGLHFIPIEKPRSLKDYAAIKKQLEGGFDVLLAMQASTRANLIYPLVKAKRKIGFDRTRARELQWLWTNQTIDFRAEHLHDSFCQFAQQLTDSALDTQSSQSWAIQLNDIEANTDSFRLPERYIVINPAASKLERSWFARDYAEVIDYCVQKYRLTVVLTGGTQEFESKLAQECQRLCQSPVINLVGKTKLQQLARVLEQADFCIAPDTGPAHIANAMGTPVIGLYAVAPSRLSGPYRYQDLTLDRYEQAVSQFLHKDPQQIPWRTRVHNRQAMSLITVEAVKAKVDTVIAAG